MASDFFAITQYAVEGGSRALQHLHQSNELVAVRQEPGALLVSSLQVFDVSHGHAPGDAMLGSGCGDSFDGRFQGPTGRLLLQAQLTDY